MPAKDNLGEHFNGGAAGSGRSQAESEYATGQRSIPPQVHEMSAQSQSAVREGFTNSMSGWKSREQGMADRGASSALSQSTVDRLTDSKVDIPTASGNMAHAWERMMDSSDKPDPSWYFGHHRRLAAVAEKHGADPDKTMSASAAMSPQNGPDNEYRAVAAMTDAAKNGRMVKDKSTGKSRKLTTMTSDEMQQTTGSANAKNVSSAPDFDLEGFRSAGTNRQEGWKTVTDPDYNAVDNMQSAKVPLYDAAIRGSKPDTPLHAEYEARFGDQQVARTARQRTAADEAAGKTGSETLHGIPDRVDTYGLMGRGSDSDASDPIHDHPILGSKGIAVPDTWVAGILSGQDMRDHPDTASPAKMAGSQTKSTSSNVPGNTFAGKAEVDKNRAAGGGGKALSGNAAWGMAAVEAIQGAAAQAREPGSQTSIPPVMMQEMTWTHERAEVAKSTRVAAQDPANTRGPGSVGNRVAKLTSGGLQGEKEFRPQTGSRQTPEIQSPGMFHRGSDNPLDTDSVRVIPGKSGTAVHGRNPAMDAFHANAGASGKTDDLSKRRAIKSAHMQQATERAQRGITDHSDPRRG